MRAFAQLARINLVAAASMVLGGCSLLLGDDLDGLRPYPADAHLASDARDRDAPSDKLDVATPDAQTDPSDAATVDGRVHPTDAAELDTRTTDAQARDALAPDAPAPDTPAPDTPAPDATASDAPAVDADVDVAIADGPNDVNVGGHDVSDDKGGKTADVIDAPSDALPPVPDAPPDTPTPPGDGGIVGLGAWVISGPGVRLADKIEVRGWMIPSTSVRATTRSGLKIEGYLQ